jgi:hypothetical protein
MLGRCYRYGNQLSRYRDLAAQKGSGQRLIPFLIDLGLIGAAGHQERIFAGALNASISVHATQLGAQGSKTTNRNQKASPCPPFRPKLLPLLLITQTASSAFA